MWKITYHKRVVKEDIPNLDKIIKNRIKTNIEEKLIHQPEIYSKPLQGTLKNLHSMRVGDYRIVFQVLETEQELFVLIIKHRNSVYEIIDKRL
jgi:mRNA interferase RelE/StbE